MRCISPKISRNAGFTLVEVMVIAPVIILVITGLVALIIVLTGDVLRTKGSNDLVYNTQNALSQIEQDVKRTTEFRQTSYTPTSPQGQDDNAVAFDTTTQATTYLILRNIATDKSPDNQERKLIYKQSGGACSTTPYTFDVVYFTKVASGVTSLWRRIIFGNTTDAGIPCTGTTPWQAPSCTPGYTSATCLSEDSLLLENVSAITVQYLSANGTPLGIADIATAKSASVTLNVANTVAGRESTYNGSVEASLARNSVTFTPPEPIVYSDDFASSGQLGNVKTGTPILPWLFLNSTAANWSRNSTGYVTSSTTAASNPMAIADIGIANVEVTEGVRSTGNAIYFRVVDGDDWLRARINATVSTVQTGTWYTYDCSYDGFDGQADYSSQSSGMDCSYVGYGSSQLLSTSPIMSDVTSHYLILDKSIAGTVTQLATIGVGTNLPSFIKVTAKGSTLNTSYGSSSSTTSAGSTVTDSTNQSATKHGVGYASSTSGSATGITSFAITNAP